MIALLTEFSVNSNVICQEIRIEESIGFFYVIEVYPKILLSDCLFLLCFFFFLTTPKWLSFFALVFFLTTIFHPFIITYSRLWELNFKIKSGFIYVFASCLSWSGNISTKIDFPLLKKSLLTLQCWCVTSGWRKQCPSTGNNFILNIRRGR